MRTAALAMIAATALAAAAQAQTSGASTQVQITTPTAAETSSPEAIVKALYGVISGPAGPRDWAHMRGLMASGAQFIVAGARAGQPGRVRYLSVEDYVTSAGKAMTAEGFYEHGVIGPVWRYAHIATVTSPYESRHEPGGAPFARGINHYELMNDGARWWIVSIYWEGETPAFPLPGDAEALLKAGK